MHFDVVIAEIIGAERVHERMAREHYHRLLDEVRPHRPNAIQRGLRALTAGAAAIRTTSEARAPRRDHASLGSPAAR
jgi:hypothetical protein